MKYLQIYDHNGNLAKEFPVYVDGQDFAWAADKPEAVWFGAIRLVSEPSEILVTPTPEPELESKEAMAINIYGQEIPLAEAIEAERTEIQPESEVKDEPEKRVHKGSRKSRAKPSDGAKGPEAVSERAYRAGDSERDTYYH